MAMELRNEPICGRPSDESSKRIVRSFFAGPEISRYSPHYGEALKGITVGIVLEPTRRPIRVVVRLQHVCAQYFRNSFLYH